MTALSATQVRSDWSSVVDTVVREKPQLITRTRDQVVLANVDILSEFLSVYEFSANVYEEKDGTVTMSLNEIDLIENGADSQDALLKLAAAILDYAEDYYNDYSYWSRGNRSVHKPYVFRALFINDVEKIGGLIKCHLGEI